MSRAAGTAVAPGAVAGREVAGRSVTMLAVVAPLGVVSFVAIAIGAGLEDTITQLTDGMPAAFSAFVPGDVPGGYVVGELFNLIAPAAFVAWAVLAASTTTAGEEQAGTMAVLASMPVSRSRLLAEKALALLGGLVAMAAVFAVLTIVAVTIFGTGPEAADVVATCLHLVLLAVLFGSVALLVGAATGSPTVASGVAGGLAVVSYVTDSMLPLAGLDGWARLSPWHYYASSTPLANGVDLPQLAVLAVLSAAAVVAAVVAFDRRDLEG